MLQFTCQALAEMAVVYPVNGAFYTYVMRFVDPSWGFAMGGDYAISWLTVLPFELTAASLTIQFWRTDSNVGVWITLFLVVLSVILVSVAMGRSSSFSASSRSWLDRIHHFRHCR